MRSLTTLIVPTFCLLLTACSGGNANLVKKSAAVDLNCSPKQLEAEELERDKKRATWKVSGCGKTAQYAVVKKTVTRSSEVTDYAPPAPPPPAQPEQPQAGFTDAERAAFFAAHQQRMNAGAMPMPPPAPASASQVCDLITMSEIRLQCATGTSNRTYTPDELRTCAGLMMNEQKRDCMLRSGTSMAVAAPAPVVVTSPAPTAPPVEVSVMRVQNYFHIAITRAMWRPTKEIRFRELPLRRPIDLDHNAELEVGRGKIDVCFEFQDGQRIFASNFESEGYFLINNRGGQRRPGTCTDTL